MFNNCLKNINALKAILLLLMFLTVIVINDVAFADGDNMPGGGGGSTTPTTGDEDTTGIISIFCNVINQITNGVGKVIAILILISMAIGLFLGKITWGLAIAVMVGMGLLFGASGVVDVVAGSAITASGNTNTKQICKPKS
jgi:type IV secretion system protein VirB2